MIRLRLAPADARYARGLAAGSKAMEIFADLETELALREGGDEGLCVGYDMVEFLAPLRSGDFVEGRARVVERGRTQPPDHGGDLQGPRGRRRRDPAALGRAGPGRARERDDRGRPHAPPRRPLSVPATLVDWIGAVARAQARRPAVYGDGIAWTLRGALGAGRRDRPPPAARPRLRPGDRVGLVGANEPAYLAAYLGVLRAGCIAVPLNAMLDVAEMREQLAHVGAVGTIVGDVDPATRDGLAGWPLRDLRPHGTGALPQPAPGRPRVHLPDERQHRQAEGRRPHPGLAAAHGAPARLHAALRPRGAQHRVPALLRRGGAGAAGALHGRLARRAARVRPRAHRRGRPARHLASTPCRP